LSEDQRKLPGRDAEDIYERMNPRYEKLFGLKTVGDEITRCVFLERWCCGCAMSYASRDNEGEIFRRGVDVVISCPDSYLPVSTYVHIYICMYE